jgi:hypothetical protein
MRCSVITIMTSSTLSAGKARVHVGRHDRPRRLVEQPSPDTVVMAHDVPFGDDTVGRPVGRGFVTVIRDAPRSELDAASAHPYVPFWRGTPRTRRSRSGRAFCVASW